MIDRQQILESNPLVPFLESRGILLKGGESNRCALTEHKPGHLCMSVKLDTQVWYCNDCKAGGSIIDWVMMADGLNVGQAMEKLGGGNGSNGHRVPPPIAKERAAVKANNLGTNGARPVPVATYNYVDENGKLLFCVCRFEPKDFRQKAPDGNGGWLYKLEGVRRVLYNLPAVIAADFVLICEGEKDCDTIKSFGLPVATTNCGGAKKWDKSYTDCLRGKEVCIFPDNDEAGKEHLELLKKELAMAVKSIRVVVMPDGHKDVSDYAATFTSVRDAGMAVMSLIEAADVLFRGESVPIQTMDELEEEYEAHLRRAETHQYDLGQWLPSLRYRVRPVVPGEFVSVLAGTGVGKTMILQNIAVNTTLETLLFEKELPGTLTFERFVGMATKSTGRHVEDTYKGRSKKDWKSTGKLNHVVCCHKSGLTVKDISRIINCAALKTGRRPVLVLIDYIQLVGGESSSRYEKTSSVAEDLKAVAKDTGTIIIAASQINRAATGKDEPREVCLTDGKDSGSIENSSGIVIGAWRDAQDAGRMWLRILKNTKGVPGLTLPCRILESLIIHEETPDPV